MIERRPSIGERFDRIWQTIRSRPSQVMRSIPIPADRVMESGSFAKRLEAGKHYFAVTINEMFLTKARKWYNVIDPMALVVSEFVYQGKPIAVPFVVGPSLLAGKVESVPQGFAFTDTQVAGLHPYNGGKFALTIILAEIVRASYAKQLLGVLEEVAGAFPTGAALTSHLKVAGIVMDGVESILGMDGTRPLAGHRWEYDPATTPWLEPGYFALVAEDEQRLNPIDFSVVKGRLHTGRGEATSEYRGADFLLYSFHGLERRNDTQQLSFRGMFDTALRDAGSGTPEGWDRAKATMVALYQEMLTSPDLTFTQAREVMNEFREKLIAAKSDAESFSTMRDKTKPTVPAPWGFKGPDSQARQQTLDQLHELLKL